jgi:hypothetical protein
MVESCTERLPVGLPMCVLHTRKGLFLSCSQGKPLASLHPSQEHKLSHSDGCRLTKGFPCDILMDVGWPRVSLVIDWRKGGELHYELSAQVELKCPLDLYVAASAPVVDLFEIHPQSACLQSCTHTLGVSWGPALLWQWQMLRASIKYQRDV